LFHYQVANVTDMQRSTLIIKKKTYSNIQLYFNILASVFPKFTLSTVQLRPCHCNGPPKYLQTQSACIKLAYWNFMSKTSA